MEITEDEIKGMIHNLESHDDIAIYITIELLRTKLTEVKE